MGLNVLATPSAALSPTDPMAILPNQMPNGASEAEALWTGSEVYLIGGDLPGPGNAIYRFDPTTGVTTQVYAVPNGGQIGGGSAVWTGTAAYVFGSADHLGVWRFDPTPPTWTQVLDVSANFYGSTAIWDGNAAYIFGGYSNGLPSTTVSNSIFRFDPSSNTLTMLPVALPYPHAYHTVAWTGTEAYLTGGGGIVMHNEIVRFTPATGAVELLPVTLPNRLANPSAIWDGSRMYVFGGWADAPGDGTQTYVFDPSSMTVGPGTPLPARSQGHSSIFDGCTAYIFGRYWDITPMEMDTYVIQFGHKCLQDVHFDANVSIGCTSNVVTFMASDFPVGAALSYLWDFGDSTSATTPMVTHTYTTPGTYTVTLSGTDGHGHTEVASQDIFIEFADCSPPPPVIVPPRIAPMPPRLMMVGETLHVCAVGTAGMGGELQYAVTDAPPGSTIEGNCVTWFAGAPDAFFCVRFAVVELSTNLGAETCQRIRVIQPMPDAPDVDLDGIQDMADNCPATANHYQQDHDRDGLGDACDAESDASSPSDPPLIRTSVAARDRDQDGRFDGNDNCPDVANFDQEDLDGDRVGDACDPDRDGDGILDGARSCDSCSSPSVARVDAREADAEPAQELSPWGYVAAALLVAALGVALAWSAQQRHS